MKSDSTSDRPDFASRYRALPALVTNRYIRTYYQREVAACSSLKNRAEVIASKLSQFEIERISGLRQAVGIVAIMFGIYIYIAYNLQRDSLMYTFFVAVGAVVVLVLERALLVSARRPRYERSAADKLFVIIRELNQNIDHWNLSSFRWHIAVHLEEAAKAIERIPLTLKKVAPGVRREVFKLSRSKAEAMRQLEMWVIRPQESTLAAINARLADDLCTLTDGRWYDLPEAEYGHRVSTWLVVVEILGAIIAIGSALTVIGLASRLGPVAAVLSTVLAAVGVYLLNVAGLPIGILERYVEAGERVASDK